MLGYVLAKYFTNIEWQVEAPLISTITLGSISAKYESNSDWGRISTGVNDPGGKSYGAFQMAIKTGTLARFVKFSKQRGLKKYRIGGKTFNREWKRLAKTKEFQKEQMQFILKKHYNKLRIYATELGYPDNQAVNEVLFSMGVQHGKAKRVVLTASKRLYLKNDNTATIIGVLYMARIQYVMGLSSLKNSIKISLANRYVREHLDVMELI